MFFEVAGMEQAVRVVEMARNSGLGEGYRRLEIWRDWPYGEAQYTRMGEYEILVRGKGDGRAVYLCRDG